MGFTNDQVKLLEAPLDKSVVRSREQGNRSLSYIEGWHAIAEANRIFGFDSWSRETVYLKEVCRIEKTGSNGKPQWKVGYEAKVRVSVWPDDDASMGPIVREGTGYGQGTMGDLYDAMESAGKEAETDAMKRALMTFGNPFGLALYDKEQRNVEDVSAQLEKAKKAIEAAKHLATTFGQLQPDLRTFLTDNAKMINRILEYPEAVKVLVDANILEGE